MAQQPVQKQIHKISILEYILIIAIIAVFCAGVLIVIYPSISNIISVF